MERCLVVRWSILILLCFTGGCIAPRSLGPQSWFGSRNTKSKSTAAAEKPKTADPAKPDAAKPADDKAVKPEAVAAAPAAKDAAADKAAKPASAENTKTVTHDAATLALIEKDLKDLPPAERAQLEQELKGQDPALVRLILHNLLLTRQMAQLAPGQNVVQASGVAAASPAPVTPANGYVAGQTAASVQAPNNVQGAAGLGTVQPWNNQSPVAAALPGQPGHNQPADTFAAGGMYNSAAPRVGAAPLLGQPAGQLDQLAYSPNTSTGGVAGQYPAATPVGMIAGQPQSFMPQPGTVPANGMQPIAVANPAPGGPASSIPAAAAVPNAQITGVFPNAANPAAVVSPPMNPQFGISAGPPGPISAKWKEDLDRLIASTEAGMAQTPPGPGPAEKQVYIQRQVYLRMLYLMAGQQQRALEAIRDIDGADQEFWQQVFWAMSNYFDGEVMPDPSDRAAQTVAQMRSAVLRLQEKARLELRNVNFCHKISSFGSYERFARDEFSPSQDVLVYAEVNNFKSETTAEGQYRTLLRSTIEIYKADASNQLVTSIPFEPTPDLCSNYRRDYFHSYVVTIPANIPLGPYLLKLRVSDELSGKAADYTLKFAVK